MPYSYATYFSASRSTISVDNWFWKYRSYTSSINMHIPLNVDNKFYHGNYYYYLSYIECFGLSESIVDLSAVSVYLLG